MNRKRNTVDRTLIWSKFVFSINIFIIYFSKNSIIIYNYYLHEHCYGYHNIDLIMVGPCILLNQNNVASDPTLTTHFKWNWSMQIDGKNQFPLLNGLTQDQVQWIRQKKQKCLVNSIWPVQVDQLISGGTNVHVRWVTWSLLIEVHLWLRTSSSCPRLYRWCGVLLNRVNWLCWHCDGPSTWLPTQHLLR